MNTAYIIKETQNLNSDRDGVEITAKSLAHAKRNASRRQVFCGTVMKIESVTGELLAYKAGTDWVDC